MATRKLKRQKRRIRLVSRHIEMKTGVMISGPGNRYTFRHEKGARTYFYLTPRDPVYKLAVYTITDDITINGETIAVFSHCVERKRFSTCETNRLETE